MRFKNEYTSPVDLINDLLKITRANQFVFRGISNRNQLKPTINRTMNEANGFKSIDLANYEYRLLVDFKKHASTMLQGNLELLDIVAYAQHFGLPTRLIDWTRDPFVALFFAINRKTENNEYEIFYCDLNEHTLISRDYVGFTNLELESGQIFVDRYRSFIESIAKTGFTESFIEKGIISFNELYSDKGLSSLDHFVKDGLIFYECNSSNPRLIAQQGLFSVPKSIVEDDASMEITSKANVIKLRFDDKMHARLMEILKNLSYTHMRLFPDIQSIANAITIDVIQSQDQILK